MTACKTDWEVGTPPERMRLGLNHLGLNYTEYLPTSLSIDIMVMELKYIIECGNIGILRTITQGHPHWIIVNGWDEEQDIFNILDPWLGIITYNTSQLDEIWKPREYQFFEIHL